MDKSKRSSKSYTDGYPRGSRNKQLLKMLLWHFLVVPVQLQSWPCKRPLTIQPHQMESQTRMSLEIRRSPSSFSAVQSVRCTKHLLTKPSDGKPGFSASLHKSGFTHYPWEQNLSLSCSCWVCGSPKPHRSNWVQSPPLLLSRYFSLSFGKCRQPWGRGQPQYMWSLDTALSFERKG